jgi:arabinogalactan oligomer/maltooligosaccharide transport system permease protein
MRAPLVVTLSTLCALTLAGDALATTTADANETVTAPTRPTVVLWHAYRAAEETALHTFVKEVNDDPLSPFTIDVLQIPYDAYIDKLTAAIPRGKGPDVFISAHDTIGDWAEAKTIAPLDDVLDPTMLSSLHDGLVEPLLYKGNAYGVPLAFKSLALWQNRALVREVPTTLSALRASAKAATKDGTYGLIYENGLLYFHAPLLFGYGARLFSDDGRPTLDTPEAARSIAMAMKMAREEGIVPAEVSGTIATSLFVDGRAAFLITGPWSLGEIDATKLDVVVSPLPTIDDEGGGPMRPFLGVEAAMVSGKTEKPELARVLVRMLADERSSQLRLTVGLQPVARKSTWARLDGKEGEAMGTNAALLRAFLAQLATSVPTPNTPEMKALWSPFDLALGESIGQGVAPQEALAAAQKKLDGVLATVQRGTEAKTDATGTVVLALFLVLAAIAWGVRVVVKRGARAFARDIWTHRTAYLYTAPAMLGIAFLVFVPFGFGVAMGFFRHTWGNYTFVGLENFISILTSSDSRFFTTLGVTVLWTFTNVFLHVVIGLVLALVLSQAKLKFRGLYRVLFIIPWAVPNYITALIWKGMFHPEFGAVNAVLGIEGFSWMSQAWSAFTANLITNTWLGFPFMMVIALGGLTSIPKDLYEAADLDGASWWTQFVRITLPLLRPVLAPAIVLGTVWTFNMFNIIYLVSGGAPGGRTDILITEAFRWAFERGQGGAFGYAAAYSTLIFLLLIAYNTAANRVAQAVAGHGPTKNGGHG